MTESNKPPTAPACCAAPPFAKFLTIWAVTCLGVGCRGSKWEGCCSGQDSFKMIRHECALTNLTY